MVHMLFNLITQLVGEGTKYIFRKENEVHSPLPGLPYNNLIWYDTILSSEIYLLEGRIFVAYVCYCLLRSSRGC